MTATPADCGCPDQRTGGLSRRGFLTGLGLTGAAVAAGPVYASAVFAAAPATYTGDTLVVLSLRGGLDGLSVVAPVGDPDYARLRPGIAVPVSTGLPTGDRRFALHPALAPLMPLWDAGAFGAVHAVGTPDASRSHFQAQEELERAAPGSSIRTGWLDRVMGQRPLSGSPFQTVQMGSGSPKPLLAGPAPELAARSLKDFTLAGSWAGPRFAAATAALHRGSTLPWARPALGTLGALDRTAAAVKADRGPAHGAVYPKGELGNALRDVALLIKAKVGLQAITLDMGNWDMHSGLGKAGTGWMANQLGSVAKALAAFATDIGPAALARTSLVTMSEFGRRAKENGSGGVDHGHGNVVLFLGGGLKGGVVHGQWPGLTDAALDRGDLAGTTDYRDVLAELLRERCGQRSLSGVFPGFTPRPLGITTPLR
jgi:uncharacterized protein (DUF1501 family)